MSTFRANPLKPAAILSSVVIIIIVCVLTWRYSVFAADSYEFQSYEEIVNYAYMDIGTASNATKPIILKARNLIIYSSRWVANDTSGYLTHPDGSIESLPKFHELFPEDWEIPDFNSFVFSEEELQMLEQNRRLQ